MMPGPPGAMGVRGAKTDITPELLDELSSLETRVQARKQYLLTLRSQNCGPPGKRGIRAPLSPELGRRIIALREEIDDIENLQSEVFAGDCSYVLNQGPAGPMGPRGFSSSQVLEHILNMENMRLLCL